MISIIAAITNNNGLGCNGDMLFHISEDLKRFKSITMGHPIIMGRRTFESFPKGPLLGRRNVVITRNPDYHADGIEVYGSIDDALSHISGDAYVIGGGQIYSQTLSVADRLIITEIDDEGGSADTFFPDIDDSDWVATDISDWRVDNRSGVKFRYVTYERRNAKKS